MHIRQQIEELKALARSVPMPEGYIARQEIEFELSEKEWELEQYQRIVSEVLVIAQGHRREKEARRADLLRKRDSDAPMSWRDWQAINRGGLNAVIPDPQQMLETSQYPDPDLQAKINDWLARLQAEGLITLAEVRSINPIIGTSPARREAARKAGDEHKMLVQEREYYLAEVKAKHGGWGFMMALQLYNSDEAPISKEKIERWRSDLVRAKWLDDKFHPRGALAGKFDRLIHGEVNNVK